MITHKGGIAEYRLMRPESRNSLTFEMYQAIEDLCRHPGKARAIVLTAEGEKAFASGTDISNFKDFGLNEEHEFNPNETKERLKRREQQNIERFRAAQDREDPFAVEYYQLRISIDKLDLKKLEYQTKIHQLKQKYGK